MKPLVHATYLLEKFPGKGGWTFARIPQIAMDRRANFGWVKVRGTVDSYEIRKYHLMPMGDGSLFLPVRAEIRKTIGKKEGDTVEVILFPDTEPLEIPEEFIVCLKDEPPAYRFFRQLSESEQKYYIQWVYSAKQESTKVRRLASAIDKLNKGLKMYSIPAKSEK